MPGTLFIVTAPSGAGKTTLIKHLMERIPELRLSVSYTTRSPRTGEADGREYHFTDIASFLQMQNQGEFIEWAQVHSNYYATSKKWLKDQIHQGHDILLEIDWQGAQQVRKAFPDAISIFILPPSLEILEKRLRGRGTDDEATIEKRLSVARSEMRHMEEFDYVILNIELDAAVNDLSAIIHAGRLRYANQYQRHAQFFAFLKQD